MTDKPKVDFSKLDFGDELDEKPRKPAPTPAPTPAASPLKKLASNANRQPAGEIIRIPVSPSEWTRKDKRTVSSAVAVGVFVGIFAWMVTAMMLFGWMIFA